MNRFFSQLVPDPHPRKITTMDYVRAMIFCWSAVAFATQYVSAVPVIWEVNSGGNGHSYEFINEPSSWISTWEVASLSAQSRGGYLATITSQAEDDFIVNLAQTVFGDEYYEHWLGGFQPPTAQIPSDQWQWISGEPWNYTRWDVGEPNDYFGPGSEQWLVMYQPSNGAWNDLPITWGNIRGYVLEIDNIVPEPSGLALAALGLLAVALYRGRKVR